MGIIAICCGICYWRVWRRKQHETWKNLRDFTQRRSSIMRTILPVPGNDDVRQNGSCDFIDVHAKKNKQYCRYGTAFSARWCTRIFHSNYYIRLSRLKISCELCYSRMYFFHIFSFFCCYFSLCCSSCNGYCCFSCCIYCYYWNTWILGESSCASRLNFGLVVVQK